MRSRENTMTATGPGVFGTRFETRLESPVSWKNELSVVVKNEEGEERSLNEGDYYAGKKKSASETGKSDGASSIFLVSDHGFVAASELFVGQVGSEGPQVPEKVMDANELRDHLRLEQKKGCSVADTLYEQLERSLVASMMDSRPTNEQEQYLPMNCLYHILDTPTILALVKELFPNAKHKDLCAKVADITGSHDGTLGGKCRRRILAILLFCESLDATALDAFITEEVWDEDLPLRRRDNSSGDSLSHCSTKTHPDKINTTLLKGWKRNQLTLFYEYQSMFHVPFFDLQEDRLCSYNFQPKVRLPWQSLEKVADGGGGTVYRIEIHPGHHNYPTYFQVRHNLPS